MAATLFKVHKKRLCDSPVFADMLDCGSSCSAKVQQSDKHQSCASPKVGPLSRCSCTAYSNLNDIRNAFDNRAVDVHLGGVYEGVFKFDMPIAQLAIELLIS